MSTFCASSLATLGQDGGESTASEPIWDRRFVESFDEQEGDPPGGATDAAAPAAAGAASDDDIKEALRVVHTALASDDGGEAIEVAYSLDLLPDGYGRVVQAVRRLCFCTG